MQKLLLLALSALVRSGALESQRQKILTRKVIYAQRIADQQAALIGRASSMIAANTEAIAELSKRSAAARRIVAEVMKG